jgi:hypothetical protein
MNDHEVIKSAFTKINDHFNGTGRVITYINYQAHGNFVVGFWEKNLQRGGFVDYNVTPSPVEEVNT